MKIALISPYPDITSFGVRTLSAQVKKYGFDSRLIFLPDPFGDDARPGQNRYQHDALDQVAELCRECDLIGISLMTNFFDGAVQITQHLKRAGLKSPVIWGGVHPTVRPEESLEYADLACIGEADDALPALMLAMSRGEDHLHVQGFWSRNGKEIIRNPLAPLPLILDDYPKPDYSMQDHFILNDGDIVPLTHSLTEQFLNRGTVAAYLGKTGYQTMTSRGCPYSCAYCINNTIKKIYGGKGKLRWRSIEHVMDELRQVRREMPYVDYIWLSDDDFLARRMDELEYFCEQYSKHIGLPFSCLLSPISVTTDKMEMLVNAGLIYVQMGIESASSRMQELFQRKHMTNEKMFKAIKIINHYKNRMQPPGYDFLIDVPWETDADRLENLRFISRIPKPFFIQPFTLILYPGTDLYELAKKQGMITDEHRDIYDKTYTMRKADYLNLLIALARQGRCPTFLLRLLISPPFVAILNNRAMKPFFRVLYTVLQHLKRTLQSKKKHPA